LAAVSAVDCYSPAFDIDIDVDVSIHEQESSFNEAQTRAQQQQQLRTWPKTTSFSAVNEFVRRMRKVDAPYGKQNGAMSMSQYLRLGGTQ